MKNTRIAPMATPESSAADKTSRLEIDGQLMSTSVEQSFSQLYFDHQEKWRLLITYWKMNPIIAHGT